MVRLSAVDDWPSVTVVVPVLDAAATLGAQLEALAEQDYRGRWEVVVADNGSTDGTIEVAERWSSRLPSCRVVDASDCRGVSHARNVGSRAATGALVALCDADDVVAPGWLAALADGARNCDLVGGSFDDESLNDPVARSWRPSRAGGELPRALGFLPYVRGANCGVWTRVVEALGGWDERYSRGGNDVDFSWRAQLAGYRLGVAPGAVVRYRYRADLRGLARQSYHWGRADPRLYLEFRACGVPPRRAAAVARSWGWLVVNAPTAVVSRSYRGRWVRAASLALGRLHGSLEHRVLYP